MLFVRARFVSLRCATSQPWGVGGKARYLPPFLGLSQTEHATAYQGHRRVLSLALNVLDGFP